MTLFSVNSPIVSLTLLLLVLLSIVTWSIGLYKLYRQAEARRHEREFVAVFWGARDIGSAEAYAQNAQGDAAHLARAAFAEMKLMHGQPQDLLHAGTPSEVLQRQLKQQVLNIQRHHERGLAELATIASTAPFVGLFGTVWGIMHALENIGQSGTASLAVVAAPIGEALIATAIGIATALPAVLFYNYFLRRLKLRITELENFANDFLRLALRQGKE
jgi:biopolymer transport protein ExbB